MDFRTTLVSYAENRADGGFAWTVGYDLGLKGQTVEVDLRVALTGDDPGIHKKLWQDGVNAIWNTQVFFASADKLLEVKLDFSFVARNAHQTVAVHAGEGRTDMTNFYLRDSWGIDFADEVASHEIGHMLGNFDEYQGGGTFNNFTRTKTLMSDLTVAGFKDYFWTVEFYTEQFGKLDLKTVPARRGSDRAETINGGNGMDGIYAFAGNDTVRAGNGNDWISGGAGHDGLHGGAGRDTLLGGKGGDRFVFDTGLDAKGNVDLIADFSARDDAIWLENAVFKALTKTGQLADALFKDLGLAGAKLDADDRIFYNRKSGVVSYDADGSGSKALAVSFAVLENHAQLSAADFIVV